MITTAQKPELFPAKSLMERVLRDERSLAAEFPLVFREGFPGKIVSLGDAEAVRSACTILLRDLVCPGATVRAGLIGSVSTDPQFRRQGLATKVLESAEETLAAGGALISLLWADDPRFYFARGYRPVGSEEDVVLTAETGSSLPAIEGVRAARPGDASALHALYLAHTARVERSAGETAALLECPGMRTLVCERAGVVAAYACLGRGGDFPGTIHEWAGATGLVLGLVRAHLEQRPLDEATVLVAPPKATELLERLRLVGAESTRGVLGLAKIIDRGGAARLLGALVGPSATVDFDPAADPARQVLLSARGGQVHLNDDTLLVLLFSSKGDREDTLEFGRRLEVDVARLPLEPFVWGLDSI